MHPSNLVFVISYSSKRALQMPFCSYSFLLDFKRLTYSLNKFLKVSSFKVIVSRVLALLTLFRRFANSLHIKSSMNFSLLHLRGKQKKYFMRFAQEYNIFLSLASTKNYTHLFTRFDQELNTSPVKRSTLKE